MEVFLWETYLVADAEITACLVAITIAALSFGSSYCLASSAVTAAASLAAMAADVTMIVDVAITAVSGSSYYFSSVVTVTDSDSAATTAAVDVETHGTTTVETAETAVAANLFGNGFGGIFGCPSCHGSDHALIETLKLFLPYFPLHIKHLVSMYLNLLEFMHTFEMIQNMMNHIDEYQALFKMFESMGGEVSPSQTPSASPTNPLNAMAPFLGGSGFTMPDIGSMQKMMEGSDLVDEFTYMEESSGTGRDGS